MRLAILLIENIRGDSVKCSVDNAAVYGFVPADMILRSREFTGASIALHRKIYFQPNGILNPAVETHGRRFNWL